VKRLASKKFKSPSGVYRSSWIVREYKKRGGKYSGKKSSSRGLKRWYREKWIDVNYDVRKKVPCGRSRSPTQGGSRDRRRLSTSGRSRYPLCRPSIRVNSRTPRTYRELSIYSINKAKKSKKKYTHKKSVRFSRRRRSVKKRS